MGKWGDRGDAREADVYGSGGRRRKNVDEGRE